MKNYAIILASGSSKRFGGELPKQYIEFNGKTVLEHSISAFENNENITDIIVVSNPDYLEYTKTLLKNKFSKIRNIVSGGATRQKSSKTGVDLVNDYGANVFIHDGARPFVSQEIINNCIIALGKYDAVGVAVNSSDTIIKVNNDGYIQEIPPRASLKRIQTPQCFKAEIIKKAHILAEKDANLTVTDDCGMVLHYNLAKIFIINGDEKNIKITFPDDLNQQRLCNK